MKYAIFVSQLHTTSIASYPWASGSLVMKSTVICIQGFSGALFGISFPAGATVLFLFCWHKSHPSMYLFTSLVTPGYQKFWMTNSTIFHCLPCPSISMLWCSQIISVLSSSSFGTYTFLQHESIFLFPCPLAFLPPLVLSPLLL